ncbi:TetR/AcrR family transcriptional regulator [Streptomyces durmitorensis]|uniref:TetR/AcrR family transcriptional regulator n=1 Tax=Streptomyces durmitorensis TaxID=319947 RepID=A0ABY4Q368_9ACTN|nr:TetR/AcrR family transcriptional regulator [Streptomyces durmitorensis]UQT60512.1 TetR/AcrR family transcriptional regulator [Streptomyces durmitorensis]
MTARPEGVREKQADRRARTRSALLESAARGFSTYGYGNVALERVAAEAGYTRGALYHLFANKEELALAVVEWVEETWNAEVGGPAAQETDPVDALLVMARGHAVYCRRDVARVMRALSVEFSGQDHAVGRALSGVIDRLATGCADRIAAAQESGAIPPGPPPREVALAYIGTLEGLVSSLAGHVPHDVELVERAVRGLLGLPPKAYTVTEAQE